MTEKPTRDELEQRIAELEAEVSGLRQIERVLTEKRDFFEFLSESSPLGVFQTDSEGSVQYLNPKWLEITGMERENALGFGWSGALHPEDKERILEDWARCLDQGIGYDGEFRLTGSGGETVWTHTRTRPVFSSEGKVVSHVGVNEDITERKLAEAEMQNLQARLNTILESAQDGIFLMAFNTGERRYVNRVMAEMLGYTREELLGMRFQDSVDLDTERVFSEIGRRMIKTREAVHAVEYEIGRKDGSSLSVSTTLAPLVDNDGWITDVVGIMRDVTEKKKAEQEKDRLLSELREALDNVKTLRGLLPMCSYCKKIRDDEGYYQKIESYIRDRTDADFSHGICPECAEEHFPELNPYNND